MLSDSPHSLPVDPPRPPRTAARPPVRTPVRTAVRTVVHLVQLVAVLALVLGVGTSGVRTAEPVPVAPADVAPAAETTQTADAPGGAAAAAASKAAWKSLSGHTVVLDPAGTVGGSRKMSRRVAAGGTKQPCDSVGARTRTGVHEATITRSTARQLGKLLRRAGATVVFTRSGAGGPCVDDRARKANAAAADLKLTLEASQASPRKRGFSVDAPTNRAPWTDDIYERSRVLATATRDALAARKLPKAGKKGLRFTSRSAALNLSDVPAIAVSLGNLANPADARQMTTSRGRTAYARALLRAARGFLNGEPTTGGAALGVQVFSMWRDWEWREELFDRVVAAGSQWVRVDAGWCSLEEAGPGRISAWYQERLDATVAAVRARGLKLLLTFTCAPTWATPGGQEGVLPSDPAQFARAASWVATRYRGQIAAYEVWNEPDCIGGCPNGNPEAYARLLQVAYPAIKAADPAAVVMNGGLSGINLEWIKRMLAAGGAGSLDALALHPYVEPMSSGPRTPSTAGFSNPYRVPNVEAAHELTAAYGRPGLPIWFTEFGWTTGRGPGVHNPGVTPEKQATYLTEAMEMFRQHYPYVEAAFWFTMRDRDDSTIYENNFGLLNLDGSPKPSYAAFAKAARG